MPSPFVNAQGVVNNALPAPSMENAEGALRAARFRELMVLSLMPKSHVLCDEGSYFTVTNPTPGTGIATVATADASHALPTPGGGADLNPFLVLWNSSSQDMPTRVYLDSLNLIVTAAGTGGTAINMGMQIDLFSTRVKAAAAVGGTHCIPVNCNMSSQRQSVLQVWAGANTVAGSAGAAGAAAGCRMLPHRLVRSVIPVVDDIYSFSFGAAEAFVGSLAQGGTAIAQQSFNYPPVVIGPGQVGLVFLWLPSQSAASSYEFDLNYFER